MAIRYGNSGMVQLTSPTIGEFWLNAYEIVSVHPAEWTGPSGETKTYVNVPNGTRSIIGTTAEVNESFRCYVTESPDAVLERIHNAKTYRRMGGEP